MKTRCNFPAETNNIPAKPDPRQTHEQAYDTAPKNKKHTGASVIQDLESFPPSRHTIYIVSFNAVLYKHPKKQKNTKGNRKWYVRPWPEYTNHLNSDINIKQALFPGRSGSRWTENFKRSDRNRFVAGTLILPHAHPIHNPSTSACHKWCYRLHFFTMFPLRQRTARASIRRRSLVNVPKNPGETKKETYRYTNILRRAGKQRRNVDVT